MRGKQHLLMCHTNYFIKHMGILGQRCGRPQASQAHISKKKSARLTLRYVPLYLFMKAFHAVWHGVKEVSSVHLNTLNMILVQTK